MGHPNPKLKKSARSDRIKKNKAIVNERKVKVDNTSAYPWWKKETENVSLQPSTLKPYPTDDRGSEAMRQQERQRQHQYQHQQQQQQQQQQLFQNEGEEQKDELQMRPQHGTTDIESELPGGYSTPNLSWVKNIRGTLGNTKSVTVATTKKPSALEGVNKDLSWVKNVRSNLKKNESTKGFDIGTQQYEEQQVEQEEKQEQEQRQQQQEQQHQPQDQGLSWVTNASANLKTDSSAKNRKIKRIPWKPRPKTKREIFLESVSQAPAMVALKKVKVPPRRRIPADPDEGKAKAAVLMSKELLLSMRHEVGTFVLQSDSDSNDREKVEEPQPLLTKTAKKGKSNQKEGFTTDAIEVQSTDEMERRGTYKTRPVEERQATQMPLEEESSHMTLTELLDEIEAPFKELQTLEQSSLVKEHATMATMQQEPNSHYESGFQKQTGNTKPASNKKQTRRQPSSKDQTPKRDPLPLDERIERFDSPSREQMREEANIHTQPLQTQTKQGLAKRYESPVSQRVSQIEPSSTERTRDSVIRPEQEYFSGNQTYEEIASKPPLPERKSQPPLERRWSKSSPTEILPSPYNYSSNIQGKNTQKPRVENESRNQNLSKHESPIRQRINQFESSSASGSSSASRSSFRSRSPSKNRSSSKSKQTNNVATDLQKISQPVAQRRPSNPSLEKKRQSKSHQPIRQTKDRAGLTTVQRYYTNQGQDHPPFQSQAAIDKTDKDTIKFKVPSSSPETDTDCSEVDTINRFKDYLENIKPSSHNTLSSESEITSSVGSTVRNDVDMFFSLADFISTLSNAQRDHFAVAIGSEDPVGGMVEEVSEIKKDETKEVKQLEAAKNVGENKERNIEAQSRDKNREALKESPGRKIGISYVGEREKIAAQNLKNHEKHRKLDPEVKFDSLLGISDNSYERRKDPGGYEADGIGGGVKLNSGEEESRDSMNEDSEEGDTVDVEKLRNKMIELFDLEDKIEGYDQQINTSDLNVEKTKITAAESSEIQSVEKKDRATCTYKSEEASSIDPSDEISRERNFQNTDIYATQGTSHESSDFPKDLEIHSERKSQLIMNEKTAALNERKPDPPMLPQKDADEDTKAEDKNSRTSDYGNPSKIAPTKVVQQSKGIEPYAADIWAESTKTDSDREDTTINEDDKFCDNKYMAEAMKMEQMKENRILSDISWLGENNDALDTVSKFDRKNMSSNEFEIFPEHNTVAQNIDPPLYSPIDTNMPSSKLEVAKDFEVEITRKIDPPLDRKRIAAAIGKKSTVQVKGVEMKPRKADPPSDTTKDVEAIVEGMAEGVKAIVEGMTEEVRAIVKDIKPQEYDSNILEDATEKRIKDMIGEAEPDKNQSSLETEDTKQLVPKAENISQNNLDSKDDMTCMQTSFKANTAGFAHAKNVDSTVGYMPGTTMTVPTEAESMIDNFYHHQIASSLEDTKIKKPNAAIEDKQAHRISPSPEPSENSLTNKTNAVKDIEPPETPEASRIAASEGVDTVIKDMTWGSIHQTEKSDNFPTKAVMSIIGLMGGETEGITKWADLEEPLTKYICKQEMGGNSSRGEQQGSEVEMYHGVGPESEDYSMSITESSRNDRSREGQKYRRGYSRSINSKNASSVEQSEAFNAVLGLMGGEYSGITGWAELEKPFAKYIGKMVEGSESEEGSEAETHTLDEKSEAETHTLDEKSENLEETKPSKDFDQAKLRKAKATEAKDELYRSRPRTRVAKAKNPEVNFEMLSRKGDPTGSIHKLPIQNSIISKADFGMQVSKDDPEGSTISSIIRTHVLYSKKDPVGMKSVRLIPNVNRNEAGADPCGRSYNEYLINEGNTRPHLTNIKSDSKENQKSEVFPMPEANANKNEHSEVLTDYDYIYDSLKKSAEDRIISSSKGTTKKEEENINARSDPPSDPPINPPTIPRKTYSKVETRRAEKKDDFVVGYDAIYPFLTKPRSMEERREQKVNVPTIPKAEFRNLENKNVDKNETVNTNMSSVPIAEKIIENNRWFADSIDSKNYLSALDADYDNEEKSYIGETALPKELKLSEMQKQLSLVRQELSDVAVFLNKDVTDYDKSGNEDSSEPSQEIHRDFLNDAVFLQNHTQANKKRNKDDTDRSRSNMYDLDENEDDIIKLADVYQKETSKKGRKKDGKPSKIDAIEIPMHTMSTMTSNGIERPRKGATAANASTPYYFNTVASEDGSIGSKQHVRGTSDALSYLSKRRPTSDPSVASYFSASKISKNPVTDTAVTDVLTKLDVMFGIF